MDKCKAAWFGRHRFEPRYSVVQGINEISPEQIEAVGNSILWSDDTERALTNMAGKSKTYIHDVCVKCGATVLPRAALASTEAMKGE